MNQLINRLSQVLPQVIWVEVDWNPIFLEHPVGILNLLIASSSVSKTKTAATEPNISSLKKLEMGTGQLDTMYLGLIHHAINLECTNENYKRYVKHSVSQPNNIH